jgi:hypothetical protein
MSMPYSRLHDIINFAFRENTQEIQLWGKHGESFDEAAVLAKSKEGIVVAIFAGFALGSFRG